jgi:hypothetical protein
MREQSVRDRGPSLSNVDAEHGTRDPSHPSSQLRILAVEQELVEYVEAAHGNRRGGEYLHAARMRPKN